MITSSTAAAVHQTNLPGRFTEADWNNESVESVKAEGRKAPNVLKYFASKVLAEKSKKHWIFGVTQTSTHARLSPLTAAWDFYEKYKNVIGWDIVTILPPAVSTLELIVGMSDVDSPPCLQIVGVRI